MGITEETRNQSYNQRNVDSKYSKILHAIGNEEMTAREIMKETGSKDMNEVRPRITELCKFYYELIPCGKKIDTETNRKVAIFRRTTKEEKEKLLQKGEI